MSSTAYDRLLSESRSKPPVAGIVLGSGLNEITDAWTSIASAAFHEMPGLPKTTVAGHRGRVGLFAAGDRTAIVFQGRIHFYEGHSWELVARPVHIAAELGVRTLVLTNAAGGIGEQQTPGSLMLIRDHIAAMKPRWWREPPKPPPYSPSLAKTIMDAAAAVGVPASEGIYACVTGPNYETPAEIRALRSLGAHAVGMSTVHEAVTAHALGMNVAAISCIANWAAGISPTPLSHHEVLEMVRSVAARLGLVLGHFLAQV